MGPFSNNKLCIAAANAGVLGLHSTSGLAALTRDMQREIFNDKNNRMISSEIARFSLFKLAATAA